METHHNFLQLEINRNGHIKSSATAVLLLRIRDSLILILNNLK